MENNNSSGNFSNNKDNKPKKKFNFLWIYGILALVFIGSTIFGGPKSAEEIDKGKLITLLRDKDVEKIDLVNGEVAEIYLNEDGMNKYFPNDKSNSFTKTPNYTLGIVSEERFEQDLEDAQEGFENPIYPHVVKRHNWGSEIVSWILPLVLIIGFFIDYLVHEEYTPSAVGCRVINVLHPVLGGARDFSAVGIELLPIQL